MYTVRYRFCSIPDYDARMMAEAQEKVRLHQGLCHHDDGRQCAVIDGVENGDADPDEVVA